MKERTPSHAGKLLKKWRKDHGVSRAQFGQQLSDNLGFIVNASTVQGWEDYGAEPSVSRALAIESVTWGDISVGLWKKNKI